MIFTDKKDRPILNRMRITYVLLSFFIFSMYSCSDSTSLDSSLNNEYEVETRAKGDYGEFVCVTDNKAGIKCADQINGDCKKEKACDPVPDIANGALTEVFTQEEIENFWDVDFSANYDYHLVMYEADWLKYHPSDLNIEWED